MKHPYTIRRICATLVDYTIIFFLSYAYIYLTGERQDNGVYKVTGFAALVPFVLWFVYFVIAESSMQATLGHQLFKLKVIDMAGRAPDFGRVLVRRLFDLLEIVWCLGIIAFVLVVSTTDHQRIGDMVARTRVIGREDPYPNVEFDFDKR